MRAEELKHKPHLYLDMDGVQADFFGSWAKFHGVSNYKEIGTEEERLASINDLNSRGPKFIEHFFATLPVLSGGAEIIRWLNEHKIPYTVLSAPLRDNHEASIKGKLAWLKKHFPGSEQSAIFTGTKEKYAKDKQGNPNLLIDDHGKYIERWTSKGGIGIKHKDSRTQDTIRALEEIYLT